MLENFIKVADMPLEVFGKYKDQVPAELVQIWQKDGLGTFLDGYLKVIILLSIYIKNVLN